jgi:hypothetical protein
MKRAIALALMCAARVAAADPHHVLVMRSEGTADAATRGKIDTQILKLAKNLDGNVDAGDISFSDAAAATGCAPNEASCKDEVLGMLGVDEVVVSTVNTVPGGVEVHVKRLAKGNAPRESVSLVPASQPADTKLNADVGPMFGLAAAPKKETPAPPPPAPVNDKPPAPVADKPADAPHPPPVVKTAQAGSGDTVTAAPDGQVGQPPPEGGESNRRLEITGLAAGGVLVGLGFIFWASASSQQDAIDMSNPKSPKDFQNLQDLESTGDTYATLGNIAFIGGVAVAAVSGYFLWRDRHHDRAPQSARLAPAVFDHGAGLTLSFGGTR